MFFVCFLFIFTFLPFEHLLPPSVLFFFASLSLARLRKTGAIAPETRLRRLPDSVGVCLFWCALCVGVCRRVDVCRLYIEKKRKPRFVFLLLYKTSMGLLTKRLLRQHEFFSIVPLNECSFFFFEEFLRRCICTQFLHEISQSIDSIAHTTARKRNFLAQHSNTWCPLTVPL